MSRNCSILNSKLLGEYLNYFLVGREKKIDDFLILSHRMQNRIMSRLSHELLYYGSYGSLFEVKHRGRPIKYRGYLNRYITSICNSIVQIKSCSIPRVLYHGTTLTFLKDILKDGLLPSCAGKCYFKDKEKKVWFTTNLCVAEGFAWNAIKIHGGEPTILVIKPIDVELRLDIIEKIESSSGNISAFKTYRRYFTECIVEPNKIVDALILPKMYMVNSVFDMIQGFRVKD